MKYEIHSVFSGLGRGAAVALLSALLAVPAPVQAACVCGFGDGILTLMTITVDGNTADWAPVLADLDNNVCDGPPGADRDAPVQSTGRDLTHFSFTWDAGSIYLFTARAGSSTNVQNFVYYADVNNNGLMETGEPVIGANWKGSNRLVQVSLFTYVEAVAGGDLMVDAMGFGDGYALPGAFANIPQAPNRSGNWGDAAGTTMEFHITWAELGLAPGSPFSFHVSSSNTGWGAANWPAKVDDNLGGCGGGAGTTQFAGLTFAGDENLSGYHLDTLFGVKLLTNTGNGTDTFNFTSVIGGAHTPTLSYYEDVDGSGTLSPGDIALVDTDGDGNVDTGPVLAAATFDLLIGYTIGFVDPQNPSGVATIDTTASSSFNPLATALVSDTVTIIIDPDLLVMKSVVTISDPINGVTNPKAIPGAVVRYTIQVTNEGGAPTDANTVSVLDPIPVLGDLYVNDLGAPGSGPVLFSDGATASGLTYTFISLASGADSLFFSNDGGATFTYTPIPDASGYDTAVTHIRVDPTGALAAGTGAGNPSFSLGFNVRVQ